MSVTFESIGTIETPFNDKEGMPVQAKGAAAFKGKIVVKPKFAEGLKDIDDFSHLILIYHLHRADGYNLIVTPFLDDQEHGIFATRSPKRPNPIGISVVKLTEVKNNVLYIENVDMLNNTPLLDIKPYIPDFDVYPTDKNGWTENKTDKLDQKKSDARFK